MIRVRVAAMFAALGGLGACPKPAGKENVQLADPIASIEGDPTQRMKVELADQILASYERDDPPEIETAMIAQEVGPARIGVGPGDVLITADDFARVPSRWPLFLGKEARIDVRSKRLEIEFSRDRTAAFTSDELSWRVPACGRTTVIPMRITALYAHDGDRWVQVFEHMSYARTPVADPEGLVGREFKSVSLDRDLSDELSRAVARNPGYVAPDAILIGPDVSDAWEGSAATAALPAALISEHRRVGLVGRAVATSTIAYWVGTFTIDTPTRLKTAGGKVRMRGTFVFERRKRDGDLGGPTSSGLRRPAKRTVGALNPLRDVMPKAVNACNTDASGCRWVLVQAHLSQPIRDLDLATSVFGVSLAKPYAPEQPLSVTCD